MKSKYLLSALIAFSIVCSSAGAAELAGVPMKDHHLNAMGDMLTCETCHGVKTPVTRPDDKTCIACHGTMDKIPTKPNKFDKFPHNSDHYKATLECTACHAEHKPSRAICNDCHVVEFPNLK